MFGRRNSGRVKVFLWDKAASNYIQLGASIVGDAAGDELGRSASLSEKWQDVGDLIEWLMFSPWCSNHIPPVSIL